jgi:ABC-type multidrug transport system ATPase subunit
MDEPFVHLDQKTAMFLLEKLQKFTSLGGSLILTTHQLELSKSLKAQWVILKNGKIVYQGNANSTSDDITQIYTKLTS